MVLSLAHTACSDGAHTALGPGPSGGLVAGTNPRPPTPPTPVVHVSDCDSNWLSCRLLPPVPLLPPHLIPITRGRCRVEFWPHPPPHPPSYHSLSPIFSHLSFLHTKPPFSLQLWMFSNHYLPFSFFIIILLYTYLLWLPSPSLLPLSSLPSAICPLFLL